LKEYGAKKTEHIGVCWECNTEKLVRLFLTTEQKEVEVCMDCYLKI